MDDNKYHTGSLLVITNLREVATASEVTGRVCVRGFRFKRVQDGRHSDKGFGVFAVFQPQSANLSLMTQNIPLNFHNSFLTITLLT